MIIDIIEMSIADRLLSEDATTAEQKVIDESVERTAEEFDFCLKVEVCPYLLSWTKSCVERFLNISTDEYAETNSSEWGRIVEDKGELDMNSGPESVYWENTHIIHYGFNLPKTSNFEYYLKMICSLSALKKRLVDYYSEEQSYNIHDAVPQIICNFRINRKEREPAHISRTFRYDDMDAYVYSYFPHSSEECNPDLYDGFFLRTRFQQYTQDYYDRKTKKYFAEFTFIQHGSFEPVGEIHIEESDFWAYYGRVSVTAYLIELICNYSNENGNPLAEIDENPIPLYRGAYHKVRKMMSDYFQIDKDYYCNQHQDCEFVFSIAWRVLQEFKNSDNHSLEHLGELINSCRGTTDPEGHPEELDWDFYESYLSWAFKAGRKENKYEMLPDLIRKIKHDDIK